MSHQLMKLLKCLLSVWAEIELLAVISEKATTIRFTNPRFAWGGDGGFSGCVVEQAEKPRSPSLVTEMRGV